MKPFPALRLLRHNPQHWHVAPVHLAGAPLGHGCVYDICAGRLLAGELWARWREGRYCRLVYVTDGYQFHPAHRFLADVPVGAQLSMSPRLHMDPARLGYLVEQRVDYTVPTPQRPHAFVLYEEDDLGQLLIYQPLGLGVALLEPESIVSVNFQAPVIVVQGA